MANCCLGGIASFTDTMKDHERGREADDMATVVVFHETIATGDGAPFLEYSCLSHQIPFLGGSQKIRLELNRG